MRKTRVKVAKFSIPAEEKTEPRVFVEENSVDRKALE